TCPEPRLGQSLAELTVSAHASEEVSIEKRLPVRIHTQDWGGGANMRIAFNSSYIVSTLNALVRPGGTIAIECQTSSAPGRLYPADADRARQYAIVMPMFVQW
ncbi:MAG: hypothetical protein Q8R28_22260, partial [Dehalococcoidia bacterium]|nr:hypothetical protein [Dehalococcoidia bacterium]